MSTNATSDRSVRQRVLQAAKTVVAVLVIVTLGYLSVMSIEYSLGSRDASSALLGARTPATADIATGAVAPQRTGGAVGTGVPCATFPDMTCPPAHYSNTTADEAIPPTF